MTDDRRMRFVWAWGLCLSPLLPLAALGLVLRDSVGTAGRLLAVLALVPGVLGVLLVHIAVGVLVYRVLKAGDLSSATAGVVPSTAKPSASAAG